jgi:hypothetical protein
MKSLRAYAIYCNEVALLTAVTFSAGRERSVLAEGDGGSRAVGRRGTAPRDVLQDSRRLGSHGHPGPGDERPRHEDPIGEHGGGLQQAGPAPPGRGLRKSRPRLAW